MLRASRKGIYKKMELKVSLKLKENGMWKDAVLKNEEGNSKVYLEISDEGEKIIMGPGDISMIKIPGYEDLNKEQYTAGGCLNPKGFGNGI